MTALYVTRLWQGKQASLPDRLVLALLFLPSFLYAWIMTLRSWCYRTGILKTSHLPLPVISIGNITVGGTGKTPVTAHIAQLLLEKGLRVVVLSRGYGGSLEGQCAVVSDGVTLFEQPDACGDEPYLLASTVPGLAVVIGSNRYQAGLLALERLKPDVFLLDDGFQHIRLHRDVNILLLDCTSPFGNGKVLPAGPLREPLSALQRADLVIHTRCAEEQQPSATIRGSIASCKAGYRLGRFYRYESGTELAREQLGSEPVIACAGIAHPSSFFNGLKEIGIVPCTTVALPDHVSYSAEQVASLNQLAKEHKACWLLTTEKDAVKLAQRNDLLDGLIVVAVGLELDFKDEQALRQTLDNLLFKGRPPAA